ncbi:MAG: hypothetical protein RMJ88_15535 [Thermogemmata sp.]|nr:hypothetical protein [Thermogemmata sp.]
MYDQGSIFVELYTQRLEEYACFFQRVCGFTILRRHDDFYELRSSIAVILLNADEKLSAGHPFQGWLSETNKGIGVEIGIVVSDLEAARAAALLFSGWTVTDIRQQDWGLSDFRVTTPDGYYLRLTTPPTHS